MKRYLFALTVVAAAACFDVSNPVPPTLVLSPVLDSLFVGDSLVPRDFAYYNGDGERANPGPLNWSIGPTAVATINPTTGVIHGVGKGVATVTASGGNATGIALVAVSRPLDLTLLMDTVVLMPGDTLSLAPFLAITQKVANPTTLTFDPSPDPTLYTIDASGVITALNKSAAARYVAHLTELHEAVDLSRRDIPLRLTPRGPSARAIKMGKASLAAKRRAAGGQRASRASTRPERVVEGR